MASRTARKNSVSAAGYRDIASRATDDDDLRISGREPERRYETKRLRGIVTILVVLIGIPTVVIVALIGLSGLAQNLGQ